ncbi:MAG: amidohydrolase family protein [Actinobacteria bacterium]|nr:amidohydrolase family protein [Actinomycetota bacterium]
MLDLIIRDADIVDGLGGPRRHGDIGVVGGRVVAVGEVPGRATREIDAEGRVAAPGFIDVHTHYDAQAFWDPTLSPSSLHGVTTVLAGNCGFSIAPLDDRAAEYLRPMLARVEGMPLESLELGVPWDWRTTAEFLDRLDGALALNAGFSVGHSAIRRVVMGEAANERACRKPELVAMEALLAAGLQAGAIGFSSSWASPHKDAEGRPVPSRFADEPELLALAGVCGRYPGTSLEFAPAWDDNPIPIMVAMSVVAGRPLNWNVLMPTAANAELCRERLEAGTEARRGGGKIVALTQPLASQPRLSFATGVIFDALPGWHETMHLPPEEKLHALGDPAVRAELRTRAQQPSDAARFARWSDMVVYETFAPGLERVAGRKVADIAAAEGKDPFDALLDVVCADRLATRCGYEGTSTREDWEVRLRIWRDDRVVIGGSDAGAHLDMVTSFSYTTRFLGGAVRHEGLLPLEEAVQMITDAPARLYGLRDRGRLVEGAWADIVVFDEATVGSAPVETRFDLPGGAGRLYAESTGIDRVLVRGVDVVAEGEVTDARPGSVLRRGVDTMTPVMT